VIIHGATRAALMPIALVLAGRGARVVVTGPDERALGELVGEIVFGGGKARHVVGALDDATTFDAAWLKAESAFAAPSHVVAEAADTVVREAAAARSVPVHLAHETVFDVPTATRWLDSLGSADAS
jgi:NAD(P)-dependent dehydrogenase (short-subunit alcohol dehydrogenase family)